MCSVSLQTLFPKMLWPATQITLKYKQQVAVSTIFGCKQTNNLKHVFMVLSKICCVYTTFPRTFTVNSTVNVIFYSFFTLNSIFLSFKVNEWSLKIRKEMRVIDRQIRDIQREEEKVKRSIKDAAKKGHRDVCVVLAKEMIHSKRAVSKLYASKAQMNSVLLSMKNQLSVLRVAGALQKSTEVMKAMQSLVKIPEIQGTMRELSKEMMKAGIIEEMLEDTFESMEDDDEMEEAAEAEVDKILFEITAGALGKAPSKVTDALPEMEPPAAAAASEDESEEDIEEMHSRLAALRS
uniref:Charged multivesicular body protein 3 n=2 Tax=Oncorhynchus tshawytscha TaxID=74940 RepID=A0A8C8CPU7_ONCTS